MTLKKFAWLLHCNDEGQDKGQQHVSVNWVMPWGTTGSGDWSPNDDVSDNLTGEQVFEQTGGLVFPWRHTILTWYGVITDGVPPEEVQLTDTVTNPDCESEICEKIEAELCIKTKACPKPFSLDAAYLDNGHKTDQPGSRGGASLPHAFAPLTHLPAPISQDMLGVCRAFSYANANGTYLAFAPQFSARIKKLDYTLTPTSVTPRGNIFSIAYSADPPLPKLELEFSVITKALVQNPDRSHTANGSSAKCSLGGAEQADLSAREMMVSNALSPLALLVASFDSLDDLSSQSVYTGIVPTSAEEILLPILGCGLVREDLVKRPGQDDETRYVAVWERVKGGSEKHFSAIAGWLGSTNTVAVFMALNRHCIDKKKELPEMWAAMASVIQAMALESEEGKTPHWPKDSFGAPRGRAIISAANILIGSANARYFWAAWFATIAFEYVDSVKPQGEFWKTKFVDWYQLLIGVLDDHLVAALRCNVELRKCAEDWITHPELISPRMAKVLNKRYTAQIARRIRHKENDSAGWVRDILLCTGARRVAELREALITPDSIESLGEDRDLAITVTFSADELNQEIRGYAVAMAAGFDVPSKELGCSWVTDVACKIDGEVLKDGKEPMRLHDTVGATKINGRDVINFPYSGLPLNGSLTSLKNTGDADGVDTLDFFWPEKWETPKLAYGLNYWAEATPIGNAGRVMDKRFAMDNDRKLKDIAEVSFSGKGVLYQCRVAPGSPVIALDTTQLKSDPYKYHDESRTRVYLYQTHVDGRRAAEERIAVIRPKDNGEIWKGGAHSIKFTVRGPDGTPNVIERWLETDIAECKVTGKSSDDDAKNIDVADLQAIQIGYRNIFRAEATERIKPEVARPRHPAVRAFGVEVQFFDAFGQRKESETHILKPKISVANGYIDDVTIDIQAATRSGTNVLENDGKKLTLTVTLTPGRFASFTVYSLASEQFFGETPGIGRMAAFEGTRWPGIADQEHRSFSPATHWVECLANPPQPDERVTKNLALLEKIQKRFTVTPEGSNVVAAIRTCDRVCDKPDEILASTWLKGFFVQRHEWHWTGYPIAFPRFSKTQLQDWTEPFIGTESLRESLMGVLQTSLDANGVPGWHFATQQPEVVCRTPLPAEYGGKYVAYVIRPVRRFNSWLKPWPEFDNALLAEGALLPAKVRWDDPALRLSPPDVKTAVPLVKTFEVADGGEPRLSISANGSLLCLRDALHRTDPMARFGGVGEIIEVDLEETRFNEVFEIGPNPVFHAGPKAETEPNDGGIVKKVSRIDLPYNSIYAKSGKVASNDTSPKRKMNWRLRAGLPFGLTHDMDRNPKVAQTAIIVRPEGTDVSTYWVMAKVRLRRLLDPDQAWTAPSFVPKDSSAKNIWLLGRRADGEDWVPHDFCVEVQSGSMTKLWVDGGPVLTPKNAGAVGSRSRYLCSWHKGQWNNSDQTLWGLQVFFQELSNDRGQWETIERYSPYELQNKSTLDVSDPQPVKLFIEPPPVGDANGVASFSVCRLLTSDYSEPRWLTFIGLPFRNISFANESYWVAHDKGENKNDVLTLMRSNRITGNQNGFEKGEPISRDLLINPVKAIDFGGDDSDRVAAETNSFHLLLMFKRVNDVTAPADGMPLGQLLGVYKPTRDEITLDKPYPPVRFTRFMDAGQIDLPSSHEDCIGFIYKFHTTHGDEFASHSITSWEKLIERMFPIKDPVTQEGDEATVRWTPEFIGPIYLTNEGEWPSQIKPPSKMAASLQVAIQQAAGGKPEKAVVIDIDPATGWRVSKSQLWLEAPKSGTCRIHRPQQAEGVNLELEASGGRLIARLHAWPGDGLATGSDKKKAELFDNEGKLTKGDYWIEKLSET